MKRLNTTYGEYLTSQLFLLTDNKSVTKFFQVKFVTGNLWNAVDYILSFNFVIGHIPGKANGAANCFSRIILNPATKMRLNLENQIPVRKIDILKNTPKNQLCEFAPIEGEKKIEDNFKIPTIEVETEESEVDTVIDEFTSIESLINSLENQA